MKTIGFDTETTGVDNKTARILSAAIVEINEDGSYVGEELLLNPGIEIPEESSQVHGMTTEFIRENGGDPKEQLKKIAKVLNSADRIVIYNANYDLPLMVEELKRNGLPPLDEGVSRKVIDPLILDRHYNKYRKGKRTLEANAKNYDVEIEGDLHNATTDVITTLKILEKQEELYPAFFELSEDRRFAEQARWHKDFAENLNKWKGEDVVDPSWLDSRFLKGWHIEEDGTVSRCDAVYSCPLDELDVHYPTEDKAWEAAAIKFPPTQLFSDEDFYLLDDD